MVNRLFKRMLSLGIAVMMLSASLTVMAAPANFNAAYYAAANPDVVAVVGTSEAALYNHYINFGIKEGRKPNADAIPVNQTVAGSVGTTRPTQTSQSAALLEQRLQVLNLVNQQRKANGLGTLILDEKLNSYAMVRANDIATVFAHTRPDGSSVWNDFPYTNVYRGENLAKGYSSAEGTVNDWMNSATHRANILFPGFKKLGVGIVNGNWTQLFSS